MISKFFVTALSAAAMTATALGIAGIATAAPTGPSQVEDTMKALEAEGYNVILNRTGTAPLSACSVVSVLPGHTYSTVDSRGGGSPNETVTAKTVLVNVDC